MNPDAEGPQEPPNGPSVPGPSVEGIREHRRLALSELGEKLPSILSGNAGNVVPEAQVRAIVLREYALVDAQLSAVLYLFHTRMNQAGFDAAVADGRLPHFYDLLTRVSLTRKLKVVSAVLDVPRRIRRRIERLNEARNLAAHLAFAEVSGWRRFRYGDTSLLNVKGMRGLLRDVRRVMEYFDDLVSGLFKGQAVFKDARLEPGSPDLLRTLFPSTQPAAQPAEPTAETNGHTDPVPD